MSLALGLRGPQYPAFWRQAPWEVPPRGRPRVRFSPREACRPDPLGVRRAEGRAEVRALESVIVGPSVLVRGAFEGLQGIGGPCRFSRPE